MSVKLSIAVFVGDPLDYTKKRHTAIHVAFADGDQSLLHIVGAHGFFEFEDSVGKDPQASAKLATLIEVPTTSKSLSKQDIKRACEQTRIENSPGNHDWNCQNWVGDALGSLVQTGLLTVQARDHAIDQMAEACVEATDG
ncbi:hypothetical protein BO79DRAFT_181704 [Aspergillus costaricaensis CBS 115574]|uniref:Uncharacterized protein n=1 Tax=Aspergillus costaricaensis CBS 115574 TaxID=1448317 RepID=A0ACD1I0R9_9EURO|nr:hypothetical protein BO79DRAFT_181704 [Aspergillus costaricaensis CBS 115574]RAK84054.1 hypothetical protein BO79DRAFT_181704 [Aspergillus costaricaensis CBS 115574]